MEYPWLAALRYHLMASDSSFGTLSPFRYLIRIEKLTSDLIPVQHRIAGIPEPFHSHGEILEVFQVPFDRLANDLRPATLETAGRGIQRVDDRSRACVR